VKRPFALIVFFLFLFVPVSGAQSGQAELQKKPLTIEDMVAPGGLTGRAPENAQWSPDSTRLSFVQRNDTGERGELWFVDAATGEKKVLVSEGKLGTLAPDVTKIKNEREKERILRYSVAAYHWSPDSKYLLFDALGQLWLYSLESGTAVQFTSSPDPSNDPKFSPDGTRVAYVRKHNLFVQPISGKHAKQLTRDKDENILNGEVDWVYAEELEVRSNYFWSPDGRQIGFLQMDETRVPSYPITDWLPTNAEVEYEKYPKPGDPNPAVRLGVIGSDGGAIKWISLGDDSDIYVPRFGWVRDGLLWAQVLNRLQNKLDLYFIDARSGQSRKVLTETSPEAWVYVTNDFKILKAGDRFLWSSWRNGHRHLYLYSFDQNRPLDAEAKLERQLTDGDFEVLQLEGVDEEAGVVYFTANKDDPRQQHVFSVKLDGSDLHRISQEPGVHGTEFSPDARHYLDVYSNTVTPPRRMVCASAAGSCQTIWESRSVAQYGFSAGQDLEFKAEDGATLYGRLLMPASVPPGGKVPLIVNIYGGPAGQMVLDAWNAGPTNIFNQLMAQSGFAVFSVDNRGTPNRGVKFEAALRHQFGAVELKDQLSALNQLLEQYPMLDKSRIGIYGWSNGGSMTLYALEHTDVFRCGVSGAPVTDWHLYDSIYTERYMGLPKSNAKGYEDSSLVTHAPDLRGKLLLLHGTADDNVHVQNSIQTVDALINAGKQFQLMLFPNKTHGVRGKALQFEYEIVKNFFEQNLK
jgi:dipeptidyl-peptidase 4